MFNQRLRDKYIIKFSELKTNMGQENHDVTVVSRLKGACPLFMKIERWLYFWNKKNSYSSKNSGVKRKIILTQIDLFSQFMIRQAQGQRLAPVVCEHFTGWSFTGSPIWFQEGTLLWNGNLTNFTLYIKEGFLDKKDTLEVFLYIQYIW